MRAVTYAYAGVARAGVTRCNFYGPRHFLTVAGTNRHLNFDRETWTITERPPGQGNQLSFDCFGFTPAVGQAVVLGVGHITNRRFAGTITRVRKAHGRQLEGRVVWAVTAQDAHWKLNAVKVTKRYTSQSATAIAQDLVGMASGFTTTYIQTGLDTLDEFQVTMVTLSSALQQLADRVGGYWYVDLFIDDVHFFVGTESSTASGLLPQTVNTSNLHVRDFRYEEDIDQLFNTILVEGLGTTVRAPVEAGATTIPVDDASMFNTSGTNHAKLEAQRITYTGVEGTDGSGSVVAGKATSTPSAPTVADAGEAGSVVGRYRYKTTFVINGGESAPSSASSEVEVGVAEPDGTDVQLGTATGGSITPGTVVRYKFTFVTARGETTAGPPSTDFTVTADGGVAVGSTPTPAIGIPTGPAGTTARKVYRSDDGSEYGLVQTISDNTTTGAVDGNNVLGAAPPASNTAGGSQVDVSAIEVGPSGTTARRLYRTVAGGTEYKRLTTISDNSTTTFTDNISDNRLGDDAPEGSTVPTSAGDTTLPVAELSSFPASGWVQAGQQTIRYTGRSASSGAGTLTGIPASGVGSVTATLAADTAVTVAPHLTGIPASGDGAIAHTLVVGEGINILVIAEDASSQSSYGEREMFIQDRRLSLDGAAERAAATLALTKDPRITGSCRSTDPRARAGRPLTISMSSEWGISRTVTIQGAVIRPSRDAMWNPEHEITFGSRTIEDLYSELRAMKERQQIR